MADGEAGLIHVLSLGAGVQSSTIALMAAHGAITPMPRLAIFADTGWEPAGVYGWLEDLKSRLPFPVITVGEGNLREAQVGARMRGGVLIEGANGKSRHHYASLPYFTRDPCGGSVGRVKRQCTSQYKIRPIETFLRRHILGLNHGEHAPRTPAIVQWRGISVDEVVRAKPSR